MSNSKKKNIKVLTHLSSEGVKIKDVRKTGHHKAKQKRKVAEFW